VEEVGQKQGAWEKSAGTAESNWLTKRSYDSPNHFQLNNRSNAASYDYRLSEEVSTLPAFG